MRLGKVAGARVAQMAFLTGKFMVLADLLDPGMAMQALDPALVGDDPPKNVFYIEIGIAVIIFDKDAGVGVRVEPDPVNGRAWEQKVF